MADYVICEKEVLVGMANAVRSSTGETGTYSIGELSQAITQEVSGPKVTSVNGIEPDENGNVEIEIPEGFSGSWNDLTDKPFGENVNLTAVESEGASGTVTIDSEDGYSVRKDTSFLEQENLYYVEWDGILYEATYDSGLYSIGNKSLSNSGEDTGEPFLICQGLSPLYLEIYAKELGTHTYVIYTGSVSVDCIDESYIPNTIARVENINWNNLSDRPFYTSEGIIETEIIPKHTFNPNVWETMSGDYAGWAYLEISNGIPLMLGATYNVEYDGTLYEGLIPYYNDIYQLEIKDDSGNFKITNNMYLGGEFYPSLPFILTVKITGSHGLKVVKVEENVVKLDSKYISDDIARTEYIDVNISKIQSDFNMACDNIYNDMSYIQGLPYVTTQDAGKFLRVSSDGFWAVESIPTETWTLTLEDGSTVDKVVYVE